MASTIAEVYFTPEAAHRRSPTVDGFWYTLRYRVGSIAIGALILAIVKAIRLVMLYVEKKVMELSKDNKTIKVLFCLCNVAIWCLEQCIRYLTHNAFIYMAIDGQSFCYSAWKTFSFLLDNPVRIVFAQGMARIFSYIAVAFVSVLCTISAYTYFDTLTDIDGTISNSILPSVLVLLLSLLVAIAFSDIWNNAVDTVLFSFLLDNEKNSDGFYPDGRSMTERNWPKLHALMDSPTYKVEETEEEAKAREEGRAKRKEEASQRIEGENAAKAGGCFCCGGNKVAPGEAPPLNQK